MSFKSDAARDLSVVRAAFQNCPCAQGVGQDSTAFAALDELEKLIDFAVCANEDLLDRLESKRSENVIYVRMIDELRAELKKERSRV